MSHTSSDPLEPRRCAEMLASLAAPERLRIVRFLADGPRTVTDIAEMLGVPAVNVAHHLTVLRGAGLIVSEKRGRFMDYSLKPGVLAGDGLDLGCCRLEMPLAQVGVPVAGRAG